MNNYKICNRHRPLTFHDVKNIIVYVTLIIDIFKKLNIMLEEFQKFIIVMSEKSLENVVENNIIENIITKTKILYNSIVALFLTKSNNDQVFNIEVSTLKLPKGFNILLSEELYNLYDLAEILVYINSFNIVYRCGIIKFLEYCNVYPASGIQNYDSERAGKEAYGNVIIED